MTDRDEHASVEITWPDSPDGPRSEEPIFLGFMSLPIEVQQACIDGLTDSA